MKQHFIPAIRLTIVCMFFFSGFYTLLILGFAQAAPNKGKGEVVTAIGKKYYKNIAQKFTDDAYFSSRPSAVDYNAAGAGGSNKGPSNPQYLLEVEARIDTFLLHNPGCEKADIPSDMVTASGSGLDPNISVQAAYVQVNRIATIRNIPEPELQQLVFKHIDKPLAGILGTEFVNVLELNIALDNLKFKK